MRALVAATVIGLAATPAAALELQFPVACQIGVDCAIQHYVDRDPGGGALDFRCGHETYDGHDGTDIRIPTLRDMDRGVAVLAAADGTVVRLRDGMADVMVDDATVDSVADRECGNGVVIEHGEGFETQYCHLKRGSIVVKRGDRVTAGTPIAEIGLSGLTEIPHVHFTVRRDRTTVDPFDADGFESGANCVAAGDPPPPSLWDPALASALAYRPAFILNAGFADRPVEMEQIESGELADIAMTPESPAVVFFARAIGLEAGDIQRIVLTGPGGVVLAENELDPLDGSKAQYFALVGKKRRDAPWPAGRYTGVYSVIRDGVEVSAREAVLEMPAAR